MRHPYLVPYTPSKVGFPTDRPSDISLQPSCNPPLTHFPIFPSSLLMAAVTNIRQSSISPTPSTGQKPGDPNMGGSPFWLYQYQLSQAAVSQCPGTLENLRIPFISDVTSCRCGLRHIPEEQNFQQNCCGNPKHCSEYVKIVADVR